MATITGTFYEPSGVASQREKVRFQLVETVSVGVGTYPKHTYDTNTNASGAISISLVAGDYEVTCKGETFNITVPAGEVTADITEITTSGVSFPSTIAATFGFYQVSTIAEMQTISTRDVNKFCIVLGLSAEDDGGGGHFWWDADGTTATTTGLVYRPTDYEDGGVWRRAHDGIYNAKWFGFRDGQDCTTALSAIATAIPAKSTVAFPDGTYTIAAAGLAISKDFNWRGSSAGGCIIKHAASATNHMIRFTAAQTGTISGITFDGNKSNQTVSNFYATIYGYSSGLTFRDCVFQNFMQAGVYDVQTLGDLKLDNCYFLNGYEVADAVDVPTVNCGFHFAPGIASGAPHVILDKCIFRQDAAPTSGYRAPGGVLFLGSDSNSSYNSIVLRGCRFKRVGDASVGGNGAGIAAIDIYEDSYNVQLSDVQVEDTYFTGAKLQNIQNLQVSNLIVRNCSYTHAIDYVPGEREQEAEYQNASFSNVTVEDSTGAIGLHIHAGDNGGFHNVNVTNYIGRDVACGIRLNGLTTDEGAGELEGFGPVNISNPQVWSNGSTSLSGIEIMNMSGPVTINGGYVEATSSNGIRALVGTSTACRLKIAGIFITADSNNFYGIRVGGLAEVAIDQVTVSAAGTSGVAIGVQSDLNGTPNPTVKLVYGQNIIRAGTVSLVATEIQNGWSDRVLANQRTVVSNSSTTETDLWNTTLPFNAFAVNGETLEFYIAGTVTNSANAKRIRIYFGSTTIYDSGNSATGIASDYVIRGVINREGSATHRQVVSVQTAGALTWTAVDESSGTESMTANKTFRVTGQGGASSEVFLTFGKIKVSGLGV